MPMCFICNQTFSLNSNLITHLNIFHDPKSLTELNVWNLIVVEF